MIFASDNWAGASPKIIEALAAAARSGGQAYGGDPLTKAVERRFCELFERDVAVFLVATGTVANALALSAYARPGGVVLAHRHAHTITSEAGATEFFSDATKVVGLDADAGRLSAATLEAGLARYPVGFEHAGQPVAVSITQQTEWGAVYRPEAVAAISSVARTRGCALHMDGARFANAVAALGVSPANATWRAGVDVLSFGGTKNGCLAAEAVIFFNPAHARDMMFQRQRAGQGYSKNWFIAAQMSAYLDGGHWLELARHANAMASRLAGGLRQSPDARLAFEPDGNQIFAMLKKDADERLRAAGAVYHASHADAVPEAFRPRADETIVRLVTSWQTREEDVERFVAALGEA